LKENNRSPAWCFPPLEKRFEFPLGCLKSFAPIQDSNEIPLLERGTNEDVRSRDHRERRWPTVMVGVAQNAMMKPR